MKKVTDPKQDQLFEVYRNIADITVVAGSLERCCLKLSIQSRQINELNKRETGDALYYTHAFLEQLAVMELHLEILHDYYQCDYDIEKNILIKRTRKSLHLDD